MESGQITLKSGMFLVLLAATVLFLAVFLGIRAGFAGGTGQPDTSPASLPNYSNLVIDKGLPSLTVRTSSGEELNSAKIIGTQKTVIAVVMPGCGACASLMETWQTLDLTGGDRDIRIVLLVGVSGEESELGELSEYIKKYDHYFCDMGDLDQIWGVRSFPTVFGVSLDRNIRFVASVFGNFLDGEYFAEHL
ncbi:MAG: hypothetical protein GY841_08455 [FCB group bacterium]|nr:hypothetical protein [FCB group bacterium]